MLHIDPPHQNHSTKIHLFPCRDLWPATEFNVTRLHIFRSSRESELCWRFKRWADLQSRGQKPSERQKQSPFPFAFCFCLGVERIWDEERAPDAFPLAACISTSQIRASSWIHVCINHSFFYRKHPANWYLYIVKRNLYKLPNITITNVMPKVELRK